MEQQLSQETWIQIHKLAVQLAKTNNLKEILTIFLTHLEIIIPHKKSFFDVGYLQDGEAVFFEPHSQNMTQEELDAYYESYQLSDYTRWMMSSKTAYRDSQIITEEGRRRSKIYQEWMVPMGVHYSMGCTFFENDVLYGSLTLFRDSNGDFSDEDLYILSLLAEHMTANLCCLYPLGLQKRPTFHAYEDFLMKHHITNREHEIIQLVYDGLGNQEISAQLFITENTVKKHLNTIFHKFQVKTRTQLMRALFASTEPDPSRPFVDL